MRFTIIADSFELVKGGIEKQAEILNNMLRLKGHVSKLLPFFEFRFAQLDPEDILVIEGIHRFFLLRFLFRRKKNFTVLFTHGSFYLWTNEGRQFIKSSGTAFPKLKRLFDIVFMQRVLSKIDLIVTLSESESYDINKLFGRTLPNFYSLGNFSDEQDSTICDPPVELEAITGKYICYIGRLEKRKNLLPLVEAAIKLDLPLVLAGQDQGEFTKLKSYCDKMNFNKLFYFGIVTKEMKFALINSSNILVISSFFEGLPTIALEAIKSNKRVILTKYNYMDPHPCVSFVEPTAEQLSREIKLTWDETDCKFGFSSNQGIIENFLNFLKNKTMEC